MKKNEQNEYSDENSPLEDDNESSNDNNEENEEEEEREEGENNIKQEENEEVENEDEEGENNEEGEERENDNEEQNENEENNNEDENNSDEIISNENNNIEENKSIEKENSEIELKKKLNEENEKKEKEREILLQKNFDNSLKTFDKLKNKLSSICIEIESDLNEIYYPKKSNINSETESKNLDEISSVDNNNDKNSEEKKFQKIIKSYKNKIQKAKNELEVALTINKIVEYENLIKEKEGYFSNLKKENIALNKVRDNQVAKIGEYNQRVLQREEIISINNKINALKENIKLKKDFYKLTQEKLKAQMKRKLHLENKCKLINDNIKYKKGDKIKEVENLENEEKENEIDIDDYDSLKKKYDDKKKEFKKNEQIYKKIIDNQERTMGRLNKELSLLSEEINKNNRKLIVTNKKRKEYLIDYQNIKKLQKQRSNENLNHKLNKKKLIIQDPNIINNLEIKNLNEEKKYIPFNVNNKSQRQPFNIDNFMKNVEKKRINEGKTDTMKLIENLKFDIQSVIKKSALDKEAENYIKKIANTEGNIIIRKKI